MPGPRHRLPAPLPTELKHFATPNRYLGYVTHVCDGDAIRADLYLGLNIILQDRHIRFLGIDAPELIGTDKFAAHESRRQLRVLIEKTWVGVETLLDQTGKFGRLLAVIYKPLNESLLCVNKWMCDQGLARPMKVNRYFDRQVDTMQHFHKGCSLCNSFMLPTVGQVRHQTNKNANASLTKHGE